jgi:ABC-type cobalamin transport system ATPase subunit
MSASFLTVERSVSTAPLVVLDVPSERLELAEQAGLDEVVGALVDTGARLAAGEGVREDLGR